jgi:hypothetical protein
LAGTSADQAGPSASGPPYRGWWNIRLFRPRRGPDVLYWSSSRIYAQERRCSKYLPIVDACCWFTVPIELGLCSKAIAFLANPVDSRMIFAEYLLLLRDNGIVDS